MVYSLRKVNLKKPLYPQTSALDAELLNFTEDLVFCKGGFSSFAYTMNRNITVTEETRLYLFNAYEPFNSDFVLLVNKKTLVTTTNLNNPESASAYRTQSIDLLCKSSKWFYVVVTFIMKTLKVLKTKGVNS